MKETVAALTELVAEQGKQIVALSQALAIAHEHHNAVVAPPVPTQPFFDGPDRLYLTEEEEDDLFDRGELDTQHVTTEMSEILRAAGIDAPVTIQT